MGLALAMMRDGECNDRMEAGGYTYVHKFRAFLVLMYVAQAWQIPEADHEGIQSLLGWVKGLQPDPDAVELTEDDLAKALWTPDGLGIDYTAIPDDPTDGLGLPFGSPAWNAVHGLRKLVDHSDCDGSLTAGDAIDAAALFDFLREPVIEPRPADADLIRRMGDFMRRAADGRWPIAFV